jgi:hypothetical protein
MLKPDIVIPPGFLTEPDRGFYNSFVFYAEKPDVEKLIQNLDPSNPIILNYYLQKKQNLEKLYEQKPDKLMKHYDLFPVTSDGNQRICVVGSTREDEHSERTIYLMDNQFNMIDQVDIYGTYFQYFVSAKFRDRLWIQTGDGGNGGYLVFYEIRFKGEKVNKKVIGQGDEDLTGYPTFILRNPAKDPKIIVYHGPHTILDIIILPFYFWYFFVAFLPHNINKVVIMILFIGIFLLLWLFARKEIKDHLYYIRKTFLSLFR